MAHRCVFGRTALYSFLNRLDCCERRASMRRLRKLHGRLRSQLELPRQPSEGCLLFWFFLELWDLCRAGTGSGLGWGGQTSLIMMDGRSPGELCQACGHVTFGLTLASSWGSGFGFISGPFRRRFRDSFWSSFGAPKVSRKVARRCTPKHTIKVTTR